MKMWIDDVRPAPSGYKWIKSTHEAIIYLCQLAHNNRYQGIEVIDIDHDAGNFAWNGGDFIEILNWLEEKFINNGFTPPPIHIHSMNPVGVANMRRIINKNNWKEV